jgi:hypothetical protein
VAMNQLTVAVAGTQQALFIDLKSGTWFYSPPGHLSVHGSGGLTTQALLSWLQSLGFNTSDPLVQTGAADILTCINEMPNQSGRFTQFAVNSNISTITTHPAFNSSTQWAPSKEIPILAASWVLIWLLGLWRIFKRLRRPFAG